LICSPYFAQVYVRIATALGCILQGVAIEVCLPPTNVLAIIATCACLAMGVRGRREYASAKFIQAQTIPDYSYCTLAV